ncbi:MAG: hypothetical protein NZ555_17500, partial [Geminicoccaceae bacterium]|nr:hypothetical protein [Geminicoccaceae bacterium]
MRIKVTVEGLAFDVEVGDLNAEPIIATVDGERFEVWLKNEVQVTGSQVEGSAPANGALSMQPSDLHSFNLRPSGSRDVLAPIPGVIVSVAVQPGQAVKTGQ